MQKYILRQIQRSKKLLTNAIVMSQKQCANKIDQNYRLIVTAELSHQ